uniref:CAF1B/HIR1 beta-propeller domain-containing protein n=1 Tax=Kalmanozyma brasiliensis (strain GHG001) TaxID=1365824 RepID=V5ELI2_KALBG
MVRSVTFEIRWHDTQPIYSCSFQPLPANHLKRVLDHNMGQAAGLAPGKGLSEIDSAAAAAMTSTSSSAQASALTPVASSSKLTQPPVMAGGQSWRLATAGGDNNARIWMVHPNIPSPAAMASAAAVSGSAVVAPHAPRVEYLATLQRHSGVVNVVRFCPKGELLATAGDDGNVLLWVPSDRSKPGLGDVSTNLEGEAQFEKEHWRVKLMCRATQQELYDMAWSPNGETLAVGGTDFVARIINVQEGHVIREISEHNHYVQGIAWDPLNDAAVAAHAMNPPQTTPSRRSSFSGSNFDVGSPPTSTTSLAPASTLAGSHGVKSAASALEHTLSVTGGTAASDAGRRAGSVSRSASRTRSMRSPSPIPPLPAIRAPPSPKQRMQAAAASGLGGPLAKASMRLYGDENFSGFFRRLSFSPDGGLLVTPSGLFDPPPPSASPSVNLSPMKSPATLTPATAAAATSHPSTSPQLGPANKSAVYLYARGNLTRSNAPIAVLPGHKTATLVVRFSPILYELRKTPRTSSDGDDEGIAPHPTIPLEAGKQKTVSLRTESSTAAFSPSLGSTPSKDPLAPSASPSQPEKISPHVPRQDARSPPRGISVFGLPYRMVYAVATQDSVWIYDTQQAGPICCFSNMHYASFTDLTWSPDGQTLMMSSTDGYCSVVVFDYAELGVPYAFSAQPALKAPAPGVPAPAHIAEGKSTGSAPNTPKMASPAMLAPAATGGSAAEAYASAVGATPAGLGLAMPPASSSAAPSTAPAPAPATATAAAAGGDDAEAPKKKRRIALTLERPLGS